MEKQTKNIITREFIEKELRFYNEADIKSSLVLIGALAIVFVPLTIVVGYAILSLIKNIALKIALLIVACGLFSAPIWVNIPTICVPINNRKLIDRGEFDIVTRDVHYKGVRMVGRHTEEYLYFQGFGEVSVGYTTYQLASQGDIFYIVCYKKNNKVKLLYSAKMYEYK